MVVFTHINAGGFKVQKKVLRSLEEGQQPAKGEYK